MFVVSFRGISQQMGINLIFLRWFKFALVYLQLLAAAVSTQVKSLNQSAKFFVNTSWKKSVNKFNTSCCCFLQFFVCFPSDSSIMPDRCFVPRCKGNYDNGPKIHVFKFPSDEALKQKWIYAIRRDDFVPTRHSKVSIGRKSAWHLETWFHSENHYCCFYCCRFLSGWKNGSWRIRFCLRVKKQMVIIRFTLLLRNDLNFST